MEIAKGRKLLAADLTLEWSFSGVRPHMNSQVMLLGESPRAEGTDERPFAGVRPDVEMELCGAFERFVAFVAGLGDLLLWLRTTFLAFLGQLAFVSIAGFANKITITKIKTFTMRLSLKSLMKYLFEIGFLRSSSSSISSSSSS